VSMCANTEDAVVCGQPTVATLLVRVHGRQATTGEVDVCLRHLIRLVLYNSPDPTSLMERIAHGRKRVPE
jgi:hypothetical protein